ncbi:MAG: T9SS type A sorting domain-containing protein [Chitinophagaceae bacterium]|nr:T9SS type A sorting domain-containing protein [Chitinophagaceae bacterium]
MAPGTYTILVKDNTGCIGATAVTVNNLAGPTVTAIATPTSCGAADGIVTATGSGGTGALLYSIDGINFQASNIFLPLATGTYTIKVKDANGCISNTSVTVTNASGLSVTASSIATPCSGSSGSITANATGGAGALQYSINGVTYQSSNLFTGVGQGNYTVTVVDANGCSATASVSVGTVFAPTVTAVGTNANCNSNNGIITATGSGGTVPYTYSINGVTFQSNNIFTNVSPATYTVTIKDANGCTGTASVTIINTGSGTPPTFTINIADEIPCDLSTGDEGEIKVINVLGTGPFKYSFNGGPFSSSANWNTIIPGTYTVTVQDANGCTTTQQVTIDVMPPPVFQTVTVTNANCGSANGSIYVLGVGSDNLWFKLNNGTWFLGLGGDKDHYTFSGLAPGVYTIYMNVPDDGDCNDSTTVTVLSSGGPTVNLVKTNTSCGLSNGSITATGSGGTAPLSYSINNGSSYQSNGLFSNLAAGTYTVLVKDSHVIPCLGAATITVNTSTAPSLLTSTTPTSCGLSNGTIIMSGSGGTAPLQYSINGTTFQSGSSFSGLSAGTYTAWVKDNSGCFSTVPVTIASTTFPNITAYALAASCGNSNGSLVASGTGGSSPYQFSLNGGAYQSSGTFTGLAAGVYSITIKDLYDCTNTTNLSVSNLTAPTLNTSSVASKCGSANGSITATASGGSSPLMYSINGVTFQASNVFTNVSAGTYTVTVKDNNGCITTKLITVSNIAGPVTLTATVVSTTCNNSNGIITATSTGGTLPLTYSKDGVTFQAGTVFNSLAAATYTITVKDNNGCIKALDVTVTNLAGPVVNATATSSSTCTTSDGTITNTVTGGTLPITYSKDGSVFQTGNIFTGLPPGSYTITVKDANGCTGTTSITVSSAAVGPTITWTGTAGNNWHDINNWGGCQIPDCSYNVIIPGVPLNQPLISLQDASCRTITINAGASLTISSSKSLMVCNDFTNSGTFNSGNGTTILFQDTCIGCTGGVVHNQVLDGGMTGTNKFWNVTVNKPSGTVVTAIQDIDMGGNFLVSGAIGFGGSFSASGHYHKIAGNFTIESSPLVAVYTPGTTLEFNGTSQTYNNRGALQSVVMNQSGTGTLTLQDHGLAGTAWMQLSNTGVLTFTKGKIIAAFSHITDNRVDIFNRSSAAVTAGNTSGYVQGALRRYMPNSGGTGNYDFPVGSVTKGYERINYNLTVPLSNTVDYWNVFFDETVIPASPVFPQECSVMYHNGYTALNHGIWSLQSSPGILATGTFNVTAYNKAGDWTNSTATGWSIQSNNLLSNNVADWMLTPFPQSPCLTPPVTAVERDDLTAGVLFISGNPVWFATAQSVPFLLPIELLSFNASAIAGEKVQLDWETASEFNNDYFTVERAGTEMIFQLIDTIDGAGTSMVPLSYRSYDDAPQTGINYYRLRQTDFNGDFEYSKVVSIKFDKHDFINCYPNPAANQLIIATNQELMDIKLIAVTGRIVYEWKENITGKVIVDLTAFPSGCYILKAMNKEGAVSSQLVVKARNDGE